MKQYTKIQTVYKRDEQTKKIIEGEFSMTEFGYLKDNEWVYTEKINGMNIRVMWNGENVWFGGKTDEASIPTFLLYRLQELFEGTAKKQLFKTVFTDSTAVCLYGEGYGRKIQKDGALYIPEGNDFILFDVKVGDWWLKREDVEDVATKFGIKVVPIIGSGTLTEAVERVRTGFSSTIGSLTAEGIVLRPKVDLVTRQGERIITKIKHRDFH